MRRHLTYANVMATVAVFVALGGTSFALTLPRNSVGAPQVRANAVGNSELRARAVTSAIVRDRALRLRDLSASTRRSLQGVPGPAGPPGPPAVSYFATIDSGGGPLRGNAADTRALGVGALLVGFARPVSSCVATATLTPPAPPSASVMTEPGAGGAVLVRTFDGTGAPTDLPFNLIVAC